MQSGVNDQRRTRGAHMPDALNSQEHQIISDIVKILDEARGETLEAEELE